MQNPPAKDSAATGQDCPQSGVWQALGTGLPPLQIAKGSIMPAAGGRVVTWRLLLACAPKTEPKP